MPSADDRATTVQSFYLAFYGRPADPTGLAFWSAQLANAGNDLAAIVDAFAQSPEAQLRFGDASPAQRISDIYETLFSRPPEAAGLQYWTETVERGHVSLAQVASVIFQGAQGSDRALAELRLDAAARFTGRVEAGNSDYAGYAALEAGRVLLRAVTPGATGEQLDALVTSALVFSNALSDHPAVMEALAPRGSLLALFDSGRGGAAPALLAEALGLLAAGAADDPSAMRALLGKGGVVELFDDLPSWIGLQGVIDTIKHGGLDALLDLAYPPPMPTPPPAPAPLRPTLTAIGYGMTDGELGIGESVTLILVFSDNVAAALGTRLLLNNGGSAAYTSGNGGKELVFTYTVQAGDSIADLALAASGALDGAIANGAGVALAAGSLDGLNPPGLVYVDGVQTGVTIAAGVDGLHVVSNKPGNVLLEAANGDRALVHGASDLDPLDVVIGQLTGGSATGKVLVNAPSGNIGREPDGIVVAVGSSAAESLSGQYVWGHGGDDVIDGTTGDDMLFGGDGNDTILAGAGADVVHGGRGGDNIDLGDDLDVDRVVYGADEFSAGLPPFQDGDATAQIDKLSGLGIGDIIDLGRPFDGVPVLRNTYLSGLNADEVAIVRGALDGGSFVRGSAASDDDFMLQWVTDGVVNSTILRDYGTRAEFGIDRAAGTLTVVPLPPLPSQLTSISYALLGATSTATFTSAPDLITHTPGSPTGLAQRASFFLWDYRDSSPRPTATNYLDGPLFGLQDNVLSFDAPLNSGLYSMTWSNNTFDTAAGYLTGAQTFFAGGRNNGFDNDGFAIAGFQQLSNDFTHTDTISRGYFGTDAIAATVTTGRGHDLVLSKGAALNIAYTTIDANAEDLVFDFNGTKDNIVLGGALAAAIDDDGQPGLNWASAGGPQTVVDRATEALQLTLDDPAAVVSSAAALMQQTLATLNAALDVRQFVLGDDLLILVQHILHTDSAALLYYRAGDNDGIIDADEITFIATFNGGAPFFNDILLV